MSYFSTIFLFLICSICTEATNTREGKITGGHEARPHSNPYVVSLQSRFLWMRYRLCGGSILSERWILSAGHCVMDSWAKWLAMDAIVGAHNLAKINSSMIYPISHRIAHPMYRGGVGPYDIAMMKTSRNILFSDKVQPIRLPISVPKYQMNDDLLITGWGASRSTFFVTEIPNKLQEVRVTPLPYYECYRAVDKIKDSYEPNPLKRIHNICSGPISGGIAGCTGDSGGPLVRYVPVTSSQNAVENTTSMAPHDPGSASPIPITTDTSTTTAGSTIFPTPMTTDRSTTTTAGSTISPISMTTDRSTTTTAGSTISPIPMTTDRSTTITAGSTIPSIPMTTDSSSTTTPGSTIPSIPMTTDSSSITTPGSDNTPIPMTTDSYTTSASHKILSYNRSAYKIHYANNRKINYSRAVRINMAPTVIGVISWGVVPCGDRGAPTVYSNVTNYMDFINKYLHST